MSTLTFLTILAEIASATPMGWPEAADNMVFWICVALMAWAAAWCNK